MHKQLLASCFELQLNRHVKVDKLENSDSGSPILKAYLIFFKLVISFYKKSIGYL